MREYLFRGKSEETKQWVYGSLLIRQDIDEYCIAYQEPNGAARFITVVKETVGQYVGLDANKNKIFEGDVITLELVHPQRRYFHMVENFDGSVYPFDDDYEPEDYKVVGNIHDNPELLQEVFNS